MIGRIIWITVLLGIGALTTVLQLDRQSELSPDMAPRVPAPLRNYAQVVIAANALDHSDKAAALAAAQTLVRRRPMPAEHLTVLAAAQAQSGKADQANYTIQLAATRGWREPLAQQTMLRLAVAAGDKAEAGRRYAALFRSNATPDALLIELAPAVLGEPGGTGQQTFAQVLAGAPRWYEMFLQRGNAVMPPATFADVLGLALEKGALFDCAQLKATAQSLAARDPAAAAKLAAPVTRRCN